MTPARADGGRRRLAATEGRWSSSPRTASKGGEHGRTQGYAQVRLQPAATYRLPIDFVRYGTQCSRFSVKLRYSKEQCRADSQVAGQPWPTSSVLRF
jgi:hypothetical protein